MVYFWVKTGDSLIDRMYFNLIVGSLKGGTDASHQNGPVERAHRSVAKSFCAFLFGANLPVNFWPYAFYHTL